ncbi:MAG TPA: hybrid sensor histidine kinase/response regulator, partial [Polyangia bacterium]|nr:hybrid sensor histidine kinase/response regulator [Polyangia bacterium]
MGGEHPQADDLNALCRELQGARSDEYQRLFESLSDGAARLEVVFDAERCPADYRFLDINPAYERLMQAPRQARIGRLLSEFSRTNGPCFRLLGQVAGSRQPGEKEMYIEDIQKYLRVSAFLSDKETVTVVLSDVTDRQLAQNELQVAQERLIAELAGMTRLHAIATRFVREGDLTALLDEVIEEAVAMADADMGTIELRDPAGALKLAAQQGFDPARVSQSTVQVTPLASRSGKVLGLLSIYFRRPPRPAPHHLKLLELLALQCADALERANWAEERAALNARAEWAQKLRESEARFRTTVENIPINLVLYDRQFRLVYINPALLAISVPKLKIPAEQLIGMSGDQLWPAEIWGPLRAHAERAIATRERQTYELATEGPGRSLLVRTWTVVPLFAADGQVDQILAMSQDVTAQRRLVDELREADRRKSEFIALLSHELRNPLAAIRTTLYVLENGDPGSRAVADARVVIDRQVGHVVRMVDDLLDVTRITRDKIELQRRPLDLNQVVRETIEDNRAHLEFGGVRLDVRLSGAPVRVKGDAARLSQILTNLLSNAIKFSTAGGTVTVVVTSDHLKRQAVLIVSDTGVGIDAATIEQLFQPFMQGDATFDRNRGGLGLGLALVKGLVELHGGEVSVRSDGRDRGAAFTVCLPLDATALPAAKPVAEPKVAQPARRVLIIDDDEDVAGGLRAALEIHAHHVEVAGDGPTGLSAAR